MGPTTEHVLPCLFLREASPLKEAMSKTHTPFPFWFHCKEASLMGHHVGVFLTHPPQILVLRQRFPVKKKHRKEANPRENSALEVTDLPVSKVPSGFPLKPRKNVGANSKKKQTQVARRPFGSLQHAWRCWRRDSTWTELGGKNSPAVGRKLWP